MTNTVLLSSHGGFNTYLTAKKVDALKNYAELKITTTYDRNSDPSDHQSVAQLLLSGTELDTMIVELQHLRSLLP